MARKPRIEYPGALYHVMNRGDRGGKVFRDGLDYELFLRTTDDVCERSGWRIHAWVLLGNHFHWLLETPEANLVVGMKWFLGAYSQRFNKRHGQRGHVFQGRYKAVNVQTDSGNYFETVSTYIHLNPARARLLSNTDEGLRQYPWSSYGQYVAGKKERPTWLAVERVLGNLGLKDDKAGRTRYEGFMDGRVRELRTANGKRSFRQQWEPVRHGWYVGSDAFGEALVKKLDETVESHDRRSYGGDAIRRHDESEAERLLRAGMRKLGMTEPELIGLPKGHASKCLLAHLAHSRTTVSHRWLAERLHMGHSQNLSLYIQRATASGKTLSIT